MSSGICLCGSSLSNSGAPGCYPIAGTMRKVIVVPYYDNDGAINSITLATTLNAAYFSALVNQTDGSKRWYPLPELKNINTEKADSAFKTFDDGSKAFLHEGLRSISGLMIKQGPEYLSKIKPYRCSANGLGVFIIDENKGITGMISSDGTKLYPVKIDAPSWDARYMPKTDADLAMVALAFDFHIDELDENLRTIPYASLNGFSPLTLAGLIDVNITYGAVGQTSAVFTLTSDYGDPKNPVVIEGVDIGDMTLTNQTDSAAVTITAVAESPAGTYTITYASQTVADVVQVTIDRDGYDFSRLEDSTGTV